MGARGGGAVDGAANARARGATVAGIDAGDGDAANPRRNAAEARRHIAWGEPPRGGG